MAKKLIEKRVLKTYQTDRFGFIRPLMLMNELQSVADNHAEILGCGRSYCADHNLGWVVTHYLIDIKELPSEAEELTITTWPSAHTTFRAIRDFEIRGADNRIMLVATSQWVLIDLEKRHPVKISDNLPDWKIIPERAFDRTFDKFPDFDISKTHIMNCRYDDVDINQHINNAVYAVWATESTGFNFRNNFKLKGLEINFKKEISADVPEVEVDVIIKDNISRHKIRTGDTEHANVICMWEPNNQIV